MGLFRRRHNRYLDADLTQPSIESSMTALSMLADEVVSTAAQIKKTVQELRAEDRRARQQSGPTTGGEGGGLG